MFFSVDILNDLCCDLCDDFVVLACTIGVALLGQYAQVHNISIAEAMEEMCNLFNSNPKYKHVCQEVVTFVSPIIIDL